MDIRTLFVTIGLAYGALAVLLVVSERPRSGSRTSMLAVAYALGSVGVLLQAGRGLVASGLAVFAGNLLTWLGLQWQGWAAFAMSGRRTTLRLRLTVAAVTVALSIPVVLLPAVPRATVSLLVYSACFAMAAWALATWRAAPWALRATTAAILGLLAMAYALRSAAVLTGAANPNSLIDGSQPITTAFYTVAFAAVVSSAFGLILLGKRAAEQALAESSQQTETILGTLTTGVAIVDEGILVRVNPALAAMLGYAPAELEGRSVTALFGSERAHQDWGLAMASAIASEGRHTAELTLARRNGDTVCTWTQSAPLDWQDGHHRIVASVTDITDLKALQNELAARASTDDLTGLLNRRSFLERAAIELSRSARTHRPACVAILDLDHLKDINDTHGHLAGDRALVAFSESCGRSLRDLDVVARLGGDEFGVVLPDSTLDQGRATMERLLDTLRAAPFEIDGQTVPLSASIGVAQYVAGEPLDQLLARADRAMYSAKTGGRGAVALPSSP